MGVTPPCLGSSSIFGPFLDQLLISYNEEDGLAQLS